jgi:hypothetical protein
MNGRFADVWERRKNIQLNKKKYWIEDDWTKGRSQYLTFHVRIRDAELVEKIVETRLHTEPKSPARTGTKP